jgi:hypothetical protein
LQGHEPTIVAQGLRTHFGKTEALPGVDLIMRDNDRLGDTITIVTRDSGFGPRVDVHTRRVTAPVSGGATSLVRIARDLDAASIAMMISVFVAQPLTKSSSNSPATRSMSRARPIRRSPERWPPNG